MASNLTTYGANLAMTAVSSGLYLGLGTGQNAAGLVGEATGGGYARVSAPVTVTGATATNGADITFTGFTETLGAFTHAGLFTAASGGNCVWVGSLGAAINIEAAGTVVIEAGDLDLAMLVAA